MVSDQLRPEIARARDLWVTRRRRFFNKASARLIFIDETSTNTKLSIGVQNSPLSESKICTPKPNTAGKRQAAVSVDQQWGVVFLPAPTK
jgi:hypothetical protein